MAGAYSSRLALSTGGLTNVSVPANKKAVAKCITAYNPAGTSRNVGLYVSGNLVLFKAVAPGAGLEFLNLMVVYNPGDILGFYCEAPLVGQCSGYLLDA